MLWDYYQQRGVIGWHGNMKEYHWKEHTFPVEYGRERDK